MARVPFATRDDLPEHERPIYDRLEQSRGKPVGHIWRALLNAPNLLDKILSYACCWCIRACR